MSVNARTHSPLAGRAVGRSPLGPQHAGLQGEQGQGNTRAGWGTEQVGEGQPGGAGRGQTGTHREQQVRAYASGSIDSTKERMQLVA